MYMYSIYKTSYPKPTIIRVYAIFTTCHVTKHSRNTSYLNLQYYLNVILDKFLKHLMLKNTKFCLKVS